MRAVVLKEGVLGAAGQGTLSRSRVGLAQKLSGGMMVRPAHGTHSHEGHSSCLPLMCPYNILLCPVVT